MFFYKDAGQPDGLETKCIPCSKKRSKQRRKENPEYFKNAYKKFLEEHPNYQKETYKKNKNYYKEYFHQYYLDHKTR